MKSKLRNRKSESRSHLKSEIFFFVISGISAVATDGSSYIFLHSMGIPADAAKGLSFILGSVVAYLMNKYLTFDQHDKSQREKLRFCMLYASTFAANVGVHAWVYAGLSLAQPYLKYSAFLSATATSTVLNYLGMKFWVFRKF